MEAAMTPDLGIDNAAAAQRIVGIPDDKTVALQDSDRLGQAHLGPAALARRQLIAVQQGKAGLSFRRPCVERDLRVMPDRPLQITHRPQVHVEHCRGGNCPRICQHHPSPQVINGKARQVYRCPPPGRGGFYLAPVRLEAANARPQSTGQDLDLLPGPQLAVD